LKEDARAFLDNSNGDVNMAMNTFLKYSFQWCKEEYPELFEAISQGAKRPDAHAAVLEMTWDAVAAFSPVMNLTQTPQAQQRYTAIARVALPAEDRTSRVLDVGCGMGLLLPYFLACGCPPAAYQGIDLSSRMIEEAQRIRRKELGDAKFEGVTFDAKSWAQLVAEARAADDTAASEYDAIVFNDSLHYFEDVKATITEAASLLRKGPDSRLVLANLNGARDVLRMIAPEQAIRSASLEQPLNCVRSLMPGLEKLADIAGPLGLQVVTPSFFGSETREIEYKLDGFYLVILRWNAENGGWNGDGDQAISAQKDEMKMF
jgi:2-polyprenyl-3-methyl-5-hydroxy-6-metoxy-1,4-benzoquinol methylase